MPGFPAVDQPLSDGVVALRRYSTDDVADVTRACQDPEIVRWTASIPSPYLEAHARSWIESQPSRWESGLDAPFAIVGARDGAFLGSISVIIREDAPGRVAFGYWVAPWARRKGVATRALRLACTWATDALVPERLYLATVEGNVASEGVATKAGFTRTGSRGVHGRLAGRDGVDYVLNEWSLAPGAP